MEFPYQSPKLSNISKNALTDFPPNSSVRGADTTVKIFETEWLYLFKDLGRNLGGAISVFGVTIKSIYAYIYCRKSF